MTKNSRFKVKRLHSRDRRRVYKAPSASENLCPFFSNTWALFKDRGYVPDYIAVCDNHTSDCDYRTTVLPGQLSLCGRYWKESWDGFVPKLVGAQTAIPRQSIDLYYRMIRLFKEKTVKLTMYLSQISNVGSGNGNWFDIQSGHVKPFTIDPSNKMPTWTFPNATEAISGTNLSYLSGYYDEQSVELSEYNLSVNIEIKDSDDDTVAIVFRYNPTTRHFYSVEWNDGGLSPRGLSINKYVYINGRYERTTLAYDETNRWARKPQYPSAFNSIQVNVTNEHVRVDTVSTRYSTTRGTLEADLVDDRLAKGAYGFGTASQPNVRFYQIVATGATDVHPLSTTIELPLSAIEDKGTGKLLTAESLEILFKSQRDRYLERYATSRDKLFREEYLIGYTNVAEGVFFEDGTLKTKDTSNRLIIKTWDYDQEIIYRKNIPVNTNNPTSITDKYYVAKDVYVKEAQVTFHNEALNDSFSLIADRRTVFESENIVQLQYHEYFDTEVSPTTNSYITFDYNVESNPILYYYNERHIDTHQKIFKIRNNELGWHPILTGGKSNE